ncbi:CFS1-like protein, partial [Hysterangium stoloniferum]
RVLFNKDLGFAEAFMYGDVQCDDLHTFLELFIANQQRVTMNTLASAIFAIPQRLSLAKFLQSLSNSRANISAHYDIGNIMFSAFLSEDMNYSSAIFKDFNEDLLSPDSFHETLEEAQLRKMRLAIPRTDIRAGHRVLEFGSGWGAFAILAVQTTGCTIDTLTLSSDQKEVAVARIKAAGLSHKITVHLMDYRACKSRPDWKHAFDRFVSLEMAEHVGKDYLETFWDVIDWALKEDDAVGTMHCTTLPEARVKQYDREGVDFINKWVLFPGGYLPSFNLLASSMNKGTSGRLTIDSVSNIGPHYARTLREWKRKFLLNFSSVIASALQEQYSLSTEDLEIFRRKWICTDYCEAGYAHRLLGLHIVTFTREGNAAFGCSWDEYHKD